MLRKALVLAIAVVGIAALASAQEMPEQFTGNVVNMQGGGTARVIMHIESYSPDEEVLGLAKILAEKGQPGLQEAMFDLKDRGWVRIGSSLGYPIAVFRSRPTEKGRLVIALTDRSIQFWEAHRGTRSRDYAFGMIILDLDKDGKGEGKLLPAVTAKISDKGVVEFETLGTDPFKIIRVYQELPKKK
jgi:hypothetical protein